MLHKYRKTGFIEAEQFDGSTEMTKKYDLKNYGGDLVLDELEGEFAIKPGDWIATGINGERWVIADDIFRKTYERCD